MEDDRWPVGRVLTRAVESGAVAMATLAPQPADAVLAEIVDQARDLLGADTAAVLLADPSARWLVAAAARGIAGEVQQGVQIPVGRGFAGRVAAERRPVSVDRVDPDTVLNPLLWQAGIQSLLGAPLLVEGELIGVLHVGSFAPRRFTAGDEEYLQLMADRAALAIHAELTKAERETAVMLQRSFLPERPVELEGFELASRYVAGDRRGVVGGDWHDTVLLPSGAVLAVVGDVMGRGLGAAQTMIGVRTALRAHALETDDPAELLTRLDRHVQTFHPGQLATVWCAVLTGDRLRMSSAGHPPPVRSRRGAGARLVDLPPDVPVGVAFSVPRRTTTLTVEPGDVLCAFTDGLIERRGHSPDVGLDRLVGVVGQGGGSADGLCARIMAEMVGTTPADDDIALLVVQRSA
ncbi:GAF domain-containing SpoIIE family protein phosphatase [Pseudonocardia xishanensis]|uniref:SpoIIE family protein phosphatase n=1 Tax=Pseudonocardia xishanensis TaxID=630995 RepID=A0ABP8S2S4_9PSEU